jgi:hypothetical protein|tara:strand:+ start:846 stop:1031 length:186 start_codon:yes stop_codon:yes gene_type:complete
MARKRRMRKAGLLNTKKEESVQPVAPKVIKKPTPAVIEPIEEVVAAPAPTKKVVAPIKTEE